MRQLNHQKIYKCHINRFVLSIFDTIDFVQFKMSKSIKLFRYVRKIYRALGIYPPVKHGQNPFNAKNSINSAFLILTSVSSFAYFLFEADSIDEYGKSFFASISNFELLVYFIVSFLKIHSISKLIRELEKFIETSE